MFPPPDAISADATITHELLGSEATRVVYIGAKRVVYIGATRFYIGAKRVVYIGPKRVL